MNSRQGVCPQEGELGTQTADRERWLLRELVQLQQALDLEKKSKVRWRAERDGHQEQVPLGRADQPGQGEQAPLGRASYLGHQEGDRARQWQQGE